jgi:hypothetical protein
MSKQLHHILVSLVCVAIGTIFLIGGFQYGAMRSIPNAGFLPAVGGTILIIISSINLCLAIRRNQTGEKERFFSHSFSLKRVSLILCAMVGYAVILKYVGFYLTTMALMTFLLRFIEPQKWKITLIASVLTTVACSLLFVLFLGVQLPRGIFFELLGR